MLKLLTSEQFWSLVRTTIQSVGASLAVLGLAHPETVEQILGVTAATQVFVGAAANLGTTVYSLYIRRRNGLIATAAAVLPKGGLIETTPEIAAAIPDPKVVAR
jgi:hypothetical protein